jgi:hypothetical protein
MKWIILIALLVASPAAAFEWPGFEKPPAPVKTQSPSGENLEIRNNAYGLGVHADQYGRPVDLKPAGQGGGNTSGSYIQTPDAYGPGIHSDQYGQPVQTIPQ